MKCPPTKPEPPVMKMCMGASFDLNLLRTLDVLLTERSVTRASRVLGRSPSAVSHALARLRDDLQDRAWRWRPRASRVG